MSQILHFKCYYLEIIEQIGQKYIGHFKDYKKTVKISGNMLLELKKYKSY